MTEPANLGPVPTDPVPTDPVPTDPGLTGPGAIGARPTGPGAGETTAGPARTALRRTAERLFAEHGVNGVSLRQINREAGQRNSTAVTYHFGSRDGLLHAVLAHHLEHVGPRHEALLERCRGTPVTLVELADVLVMPLCAELDCPDGGPEFLQVAAEVVSRGDWIFAPGTPIALLIRRHRAWGELVEPHLPAGAAGRLHRRFAAMRFVYLELGRRARQPQPRRDDRLFASQLSDLVAALLSAPLSERTAALLAAPAPPTP